MSDQSQNSNQNNPTQGQIRPATFDAPGESLPHSGFHWNWHHSFGLAAAILVILILLFMLSAKALLITTDAQNTQVSLMGGTSLKLGSGRYLVIKDSYKLRLEAQGYYPQTIELDVNSDTASNLSFELLPLPGRIRARFSMQSQNGDSVKGVVRLNGSGLGPANELLFKDLQAGTYELKADAYLYSPLELQVNVRGRDLTEEIALDLQPNWGYLDYQVIPEDALFYAGNQPLYAPLGQTNTALIEAGRSKLIVKREGYKAYEADIEISVGQRIDLGTIQLEPVDSQYSINTVPQGASVTLNGQYAGQTPITLDLLPEKNHQLKLFKAGYIGQEHSIRVAKNALETKSFQLTPDLVDVSISVLPANATVSIAGSVVKKSNNNGTITLSLPSIKQNIKVSAEGYETQTLEVLPVRGSRQLVRVQLLTNEQALWANTPKQYQSPVGNNMLLFRDAGLVPMGSSRRETGRRGNEVQWNALLTRAFYVSSTETTNQQYRLFEPEHSSGHYETQGLDGPNRPVVGISWQKAALYCNWLSEKAGLDPFYTETKGFVSGVNPDSTGYRLLTEAEWAYLAKMTAAGTVKRYSWGSQEQAPDKFENYADQSIANKINFVLENTNDGFPVSAPVGSFASNAKGIHDLGGNVMEWIHDWYQPVPYETNAQVENPLGPQEGEFHVIRGASWARGYLPQLRLAYRDYDAKGRNDLGFRVARYAM